MANFTLASSADGGQTWTSIADLPGSSRTYAWNIGTVPSSERYRLRITALDTGLPPLSGSDVTDSMIAIARPGGDTAGPVLWAGSLRVAPRPPGAALLATFTATADDRARGGSAIAGAELFFRMAPPAPGDAGSGLQIGRAHV